MKKNYSNRRKQGAIKMPIINPFKEISISAKSKEQQVEDVQRDSALINAYLKKAFLSFHHMDEYDLEIVTMKYFEKAALCKYGPKSEFYRKVIAAFPFTFRSPAITSDTPFLVVTGIKNTVHGRELRKLFIPLLLQKIEWGHDPLVWKYQEFDSKSFVWDKDKRMWYMPLLKDSRELSFIFLPLDFLSTDQEFINRESYWKLYFSKNAWDKKLEKILASYKDGSYIKILKKGIPTRTCCYRLSYGGCVNTYGSQV